MTISLLVSWALLSIYGCIPVWSFSSNTQKRCFIVTGSSGYVGREIVHALVEHASSTRQQAPTASAAKDDAIICLVRPSRVEEEKTYWRQSDHIVVMPYNMLDEGKTLRDALDTALAFEPSQCCIYHVASVFGPTEDHVQTALENVRGTEDVVSTITRHPLLPRCRLILTSSMAAVRATGQKPKNGVAYTHEDWNEQSKLGDNWGSSYQWSKAESERRAWELAKKHGLPMTSLCPSFVFGPSVQPYTNSQSYSIDLVGQWIRGESPVQSRLCVDVRDVALAHVAAGTLPAAVGNRYILSKEARIPSQNTANVLRKVASQPDRITYDSDFQGGVIPIGQQEVEAENRLKQDLGLVLRSVEETMEDMGRMLAKMQVGTS